MNAGLLFDPVLAVLAEALNDAENTRKAQQNRLRIFTSTAVDGDGEERGFGLPDDDPTVRVLREQCETLQQVEHQLTLALQRQLRQHPLWPWIKAQNGLGAKTVARLLAAIGDPYWNTLHDRPRTVGELFAYCGVAGPGYVRKRGVKATWNADARMRLWNIVQPIIKNRRSKYRAVYDEGRERYRVAVHTTPCARCGPSGKPAQPGSPLSLAHQHARAERLVMREILRDMWAEAKVIHEGDPGEELRCA